MTTPVTGDLTKRKSFQTPASAIPFTVVPVADLANKNSELNQSYLSGKAAGVGFVGSNFVLYIAEGSAPTAKWISQLTATGNITPA